MANGIVWVLLQLAPAPPLPPPPADSLAAAVALWSEHPLTEAQKRQGIEGTVWSTVSNALVSADVRNGSRRWTEKSEILRARLAARLPADMAPVERQVTACLADQIARQLTVAEIEELRRYAVTSGGAKFWQIAHFSYGSAFRVTQCYQAALPLALTPEDYRAAGLKPPRQKRGMNIVS